MKSHHLELQNDVKYTRTSKKYKYYIFIKQVNKECKYCIFKYHFANPLYNTNLN